MKKNSINTTVSDEEVQDGLFGWWFYVGLFLGFLMGLLKNDQD